MLASFLLRGVPGWECKALGSVESPGSESPPLRAAGGCVTHEHLLPTGTAAVLHQGGAPRRPVETVTFSGSDGCTPGPGSQVEGGRWHKAGPSWPTEDGTAGAENNSRVFLPALCRQRARLVGGHGRVALGRRLAAMGRGGVQKLGGLCGRPSGEGSRPLSAALIV